MLNKPFRISPLGLIIFKTIPQSAMMFCLGFIGSGLPLEYMGANDTVFLIICLLVAMPFALVPIIVIYKNCPTVMLSMDRVQIQVSTLFTNPVMIHLFAFQGYGNSYLAMIIEYQKAETIPYNKIKHVKIARRYQFMRGVYISTFSRKRSLIYLTFSKKKAVAFKRELAKIITQ